MAATRTTPCSTRRLTCSRPPWTSSGESPWTVRLLLELSSGDFIFTFADHCMRAQSCQGLWSGLHLLTREFYLGAGPQAGSAGLEVLGTNFRPDHQLPLQHPVINPPLSSVWTLFSGPPPDQVLPLGHEWTWWVCGCEVCDDSAALCTLWRKICVEKTLNDKMFVDDQYTILLNSWKK